MSKAPVFVTRIIPNIGLEKLQGSCELNIWQGDLPPSRETLLKEIRDAAGVLTLLTDKIDEEVLKAAPNLKVISNYAVGYDNIDIEAATRRGIPVGNTPGVLTQTTADLTFALLMAAARRVVEGDTFVHEGKWQTWSPTLLLGQDVYGTTLGIIGLGRIGQAVAHRAKGFGMRVLYHGGSDKEAAAQAGAEYRELDDLLRESDYVSLHAPYTPQTHRMIDAKAFEIMKENAILINTARGAMVDHDALYEALTSGQIAAAALDVTEPEPINVDHPLMMLSNCVIVPHIGSASIATRDLMAKMAAKNLLNGLRDQRLPHCVNPEVYEKQSTK